MPASRRSLLLAAPFATVAAVTACAPGDTDAPAAGAATPDAPGGAFPVTIEHALGTATVQAAPQRVVCLGWGAQDVLWTLGVDPVAVPTVDYGGLPDGTYPWWQGHFDPAVTSFLPGGDEVPFEAVAALAPDLVLAVYSGITATDYAALEQIAPTVAYAQSPWIGTWQEQASTIGRAVGREAEAQTAVEAVDQDLADRAAANPVLTGTTFAYVYFASTGVSVYLPGDPRVDVLHGLGLLDAPGVTALAAGTEAFYTEVAKERVRDLDCDVLVAYGEPGAFDGLDLVAADPVYATMPAVARGSVAMITDEDLVAATSATVLNLPWQLDRVVPLLVQAADAARA